MSGRDREGARPRVRRCDVRPKAARRETASRRAAVARWS
jgi:hypothetical protein